MLENKYNALTIESEMQQLWKELQSFKFDKNSQKPIYSIDTPPPTVSGKLHIGHIFSYTQAEMIARYQRLIGKSVFYPFGFDDNGLPTEKLVEKEMGVYAVNVEREQFNDYCKQTIEKYEDSFRQLWQSLGFSVDWDYCYRTIDAVSQRIAQKSFIELVKNGNAYIKERPVLWCSVCRTSIAQADLEVKELETTFNYIAFEIDGQAVEVATTRPEMLYGCVAVLINPKDKRAKKFKGKNAKVPLYDFEVPVIFDDKVDMEKGTGIVMCCTYGDTTDMEWVDKYDLPFKRVIENDGKIVEDIAYIGGLKVKAARVEIIKALQNSGKLIRQESLIHKVSVHERCATAAEILPSNQWYIDILTKKQLYLDAAEKINWYPEHLKARYINWVENLKWDWCISRQRFFGVPFPIWYCKKCGAVIMADESDLPVNPLSQSPKHPCKCGGFEFIPEKDVMDTWATSSMTPLINARWKEDNQNDRLLPMSMRTQAHEIIRTWTFYTIVKSLYHTNNIPWRDIMICGFVLAERGSKEKISKSKGNSNLEPHEIIKRYGADGVRYWAANNRLGTDTYFSEDEIKQSGRFLTKLWNAAKFTLMQLNDFDPKTQMQTKLMPLDSYLLTEFMAMQKRFCDYLNQYEMGLAKNELDTFFWNEYCDYYLEIAKERLYQPQKHGLINSLSGKTALYNVLLGMLKLYSVFVPHISEKIYQSYFRQFEGANALCDLQLSELPTCEQGNFGQLIKDAVYEVRKAKTERGVSMKEPLKNLTMTVPKSQLPAFMDSYEDLKSCTTAEVLNIVEGEQAKTEIEF